MPYGTSIATKEFLRTLKYPESRVTCLPVSFDDYKRGWEKTKERTSSCGPHFGHYKAAMHQPQIARILYQRAMIPMTTGYSPQRHRRGIDVMLLKKENNFHVDSLRMIVLFDSEANMNYKHIGRRAMQLALSQNQIATEQYSRPQRKALDHALNRKLIMDHQLYRRQPYAMTSCDLKSCYDRIVHAPASLALQRLGIPKTEVISMFDSIQRMRHTVRTSFGDSALAYGGTDPNRRWKLPPQGVLQGNGSGPAIWTILSSIIFKMLKSKGFQNKFESSIRRLTLELAGFAYVDDSDLIQVENSTEKTAVTRLDPAQGMKMLGVYLAPDGNTKDQVSYLRKKAETWADNMTTSYTNKEEVWTALHRTIPFAMAYSLPASTLTKDDCTYIMAPIHKVGLPRAGITSTIFSAIRSGPINRGGLGIMDMYIHMGVSQVETLISNIWKGTPTGLLLEIALEDIALEIGLQDTWHMQTLKKGFLYAKTKSWIHHVLQFTIDNNVFLRLNRDELYHKQRQHDRTIMDVALDYSLNPSVLKSINSVRMALKVVWMSDIASANGTFLDHRCLSPAFNFPRRNTYTWPTKYHCTSKDWTIWRQWLLTVHYGNRRLLTIPLGAWQGSSQDWVGNWDCFLTNTEEELYISQQEGTGWQRHIIQQGRARHFNRYYTDFIVYGDLPGPPHFLKRASVLHHQGYIEVIATELRPQVWYHTVPSHAIWSDILATKESVLHAIDMLLHPIYLEALENLDMLFQDFQNGQVVAVSDGSHFADRQRAAAAWIVISNCQTQWIRGSMLTPGPIEEFSAYRSEVMGLTAITITLKVLSCCLQQPNHIIIGCDGQAALQVSTASREDINANCPSADLRSIIADTWDSMRTTPYPVHILGHQDMTGRPLNRLEELNVMMDKLATLTATHHHNPGAALTIPTLGLPQVRYKNRAIPGELHKTLYTSLVSANLDHYLQKQLFGDILDMDVIAFEAFKKA